VVFSTRYPVYVRQEWAHKLWGSRNADCDQAIGADREKEAFSGTFFAMNAPYRAPWFRRIGWRRPAFGTAPRALIDVFGGSGV
jgi:hypothetical protein